MVFLLSESNDILVVVSCLFLPISFTICIFSSKLNGDHPKKSTSKVEHLIVDKKAFC